MRPTIGACVLLASIVVSFPSLLAQPGADGDAGDVLQQILPAVHTRLVGLERAQGILIGNLAGGGGKLDEVNVLRQMTERSTGGAAAVRPDPDATRGFAALGPRGAEIVGHAYAFHREVVAAFAASRSRDERRSMLNAALQRYQSRPDIALADAPKDMTILYDHPYTSFVPPTPPDTEPLRQLAYPRLTGFVWSSHWYQLAILEPLEFFSDPQERDQALATVADRFARKLSAGAPPDGFPTELPLAPAIASGLVLVHERSAAVIDNLNMMLDVIADILVHPAVPDRQAAVSEVLAQFVERDYRCVQSSEWILVALRHSIFAQGGPALATMTTYERNGFSGNHGQHYGPRRAPASC